MVDIPASFYNAVDLQYCLSGVAASFYAVFCAVDGREGVLKVRGSRFYFVWLTSLHLSITLWICSIVCLVLLPVSMRFSVQWMEEKEY